MENPSVVQRPETKKLFARFLTVTILSSALGTTVARAEGDHHHAEFCSATAELQRAACRHGARDDFLTAKAICLNVDNAGERHECLDDARAEFGDTWRLCREQRQARLDLCDVLGEDRYDPDFDPRCASLPVP